MVLTSGIIPYEYIVPVPVKGETHAPGSLLQPSGILFEQAAWVLMAEIRRYNASGMFDTGEVIGIPFINNSPNIHTPQNNLYDPSPDGSHFHDAFLLNLTNIGGVRRLMNVLFFGPAGLGGIGGNVATDWFTETFRNHPRGDASNPFFNQDIFAHPLSTKGTTANGELLVDPNTQEDAFFSGHPYYPLGSSGILYDIDVSELMYQPWPRIRSNGFSSAATIFGGDTTPFFPQFQRTNGTFIAVSNAGITEFWQDGNLAIRGDILIPGTEALITRTNDFDSSNVDATMPYVEAGLAPLPGFDNNISTIAEAAFSTSALPSGMYRIGVRLLKSVNNNIVIPSGVRSSVFPVINTSTIGGLHVFNDALFLESNTAASVLSPHSRRFKHDCLAELEATIGTPTWRQMIGLARTNTNVLVKTSRTVHQTSFDAGTGDQDVVLGFAVFDDVVNRTATTSGTVTLPTDDGTGIPPFTNPDGLFADGLIHFSDLFMHNNDAYLIEDGFGRIHRFSGPPMIYVDTIFNIPLAFRFGASINGDIWTFGNISDNRFQNITGGGFTLKTFDVATNFPGTVTTDLIIHSVIQVTGSIYVTDGLYVFWSARTGVPVQPRTYRLSRMTEQATTFRVDEQIISTSTSLAIRANTHIWYRTI